MYIAAEDCEGLYSLYFHNCAPDDRDSRVTLDMKIIESNQDDSLLGQNYLSAGETPLPALYVYLMLGILCSFRGGENFSGVLCDSIVNLYIQISHDVDIIFHCRMLLGFNFEEKQVFLRLVQKVYIL